MNKMWHAFEEMNTPRSVIWVDMDDFEKLLDQAEDEPDPARQITLLQQAIAKYRNNFSANLPCDNAEIESWRTHFQQGYLAALQELSILYEQVGDPDTARQIYLSAIRARRAFGENGRSFIHLDKLDIPNNPQTQSLRQCRRLVALLQRELEILLEEYSHPLSESDAVTKNTQEGGRG
ncbi:MAG: hypothetical protein CL608_01090 [Anaerolineaceae bacterium]|nr:hypothetical protein [Anaerolineaceae bacterium]